MPNILICVSGLTPQIVTETFFCLTVKQKIPIAEIYVLTTKRGKEVILGRDKAPNTPKTSLKEELNNLCKKYKLPKPLFNENDKHIIVAKEESIELPDIRSDKDNILFPNKAAEFIREKTSDPEAILYCSITGGRKSMSVHLANVLSIFAREYDKLLHVLTKQEHEFKGFFPANKKEANDLEIAEIPFVRLRPLLSAELKMPDLLRSNFDEMVKTTQAQLKILAPQNKLILDIERRELRFANDKVILEPMELLFYYFFVDSKKKGILFISVNQYDSDETKIIFKNYFATYFPTRCINFESKEWKNKFSPEVFRQRVSKINKKIEHLIEDCDLAKQFKIEVNRKWGDSTYFIPAESQRFQIKSLN